MMKRTDKAKEIFKKNEDVIMAFLGVIFLAIFIGIRWDYYYALNDDVLMKDIVAGIYTGTPNAHNIYMLYPLSFVLSGLYRVFGRGIPWYGLFLCGCQFVCLTVIGRGLLKSAHKTWTKILLVVLELSMVCALLLQQLVFVHYTMVSAILAATGIFGFLILERDLPAREFRKKSIACILLVTLSVLVRFKMGLLLLPFVCLAGLIRWSEEEKMFSKENLSRYLCVIAGLLAAVGLSYLIDRLAYSDPGWKAYWDYCDARTQLYDYLDIRTVPYEENREFYDRLGMSKAEYVLLENYNIGLDDEIDAALLNRINEYGGELLRRQYTTADLLKAAFTDYRYRTFHAQDLPYNYLVLFLYGITFGVALWNRRPSVIWKLFLLGVFRSILWMYVLYQGRSPERITNSLYLAEILFLAGMLIVEVRLLKAENRRAFPAIPVLLGIACAGIGFGSMVRLQGDIALRDEKREELAALQQYVEENGSRFYFWDVYSSVSYSERIFDSPVKGISNLDIMGGWLIRSPLTGSKYQTFEITSVFEALAEKREAGKEVYLVIADYEKEPLWGELKEWLPDFYRDKGMEITPVLKDRIVLKGQTVFFVYEISGLMN